MLTVSDSAHGHAAFPLGLPSAEQRSQQISRARQAVFQDGKSLQAGLTEAWIERSWQRCLQSGKRPEQDVNFDPVPAQLLRRTAEANHQLVAAARPIMEKLGMAIASTRYFAILTNADGVVVDVNGAIDRRDRRVDLITRIGIDLSEHSVGTTAIGAALAELQPVWLHRGEHFFNANGAYSCAGAPLFGPDGHCVGMLDLTGVDAVERPELRHLVMQSGRHIENALLESRPHELLVRLNWSSHSLGNDADGLIALDPDGWVTGANPAARQMVAQFQGGKPAVHCRDLFAMPFEMLFDAALDSASASMKHPPSLEVPLWSGLRVHARTLRHASSTRVAPAKAATPALSLKDVETSLIHKAVNEAKGNVMKAARTLGISRATVYRRLGSGKPKS